MNANEKLSLSRCFEILGNHPIAIVAPNSLDLACYDEVAGQSTYSAERFEDHFFQNIDGYNCLLKSTIFYQRFRHFETMLIYQLDAYVFADELAKWSNTRFDYIGAPWFENWGNGGASSKIIGVGNGGFSLRNIKKALTLLKCIRKIKATKKIWFRFRLQSIFRFHNILRIFFPIVRKEKIGKLYDLFYPSQVNEDIWWSQMIPEVFTNFHVAGVRDAAEFSFEVNPAVLLEMNNGKLPFGCHAWEKYAPDFWKSYIRFN